MYCRGSVVEHFTRNEGVPSSSLGFGSKMRKHRRCMNENGKTASNLFESGFSFRVSRSDFRIFDMCPCGKQKRQNRRQTVKSRIRHARHQNQPNALKVFKDPKDFNDFKEKTVLPTLKHRQQPVRDFKDLKVLNPPARDTLPRNPPRRAASPAAPRRERLSRRSRPPTSRRRPPSSCCRRECR